MVGDNGLRDSVIGIEWWVLMVGRIGW